MNFPRWGGGVVYKDGLGLYFKQSSMYFKKILYKFSTPFNLSKSAVSKHLFQELNTEWLQLLKN